MRGRFLSRDMNSNRSWASCDVLGYVCLIAWWLCTKNSNYCLLQFPIWFRTFRFHLDLSNFFDPKLFWNPTTIQRCRSPLILTRGSTRFIRVGFDPKVPARFPKGTTLSTYNGGILWLTWSVKVSNLGSKIIFIYPNLFFKDLWRGKKWNKWTKIENSNFIFHH